MNCQVLGKGGGRKDMSVTIKGNTRDPCGDGNAYLDLINVHVLVMILLQLCKMLPLGELG